MTMDETYWYARGYYDGRVYGIRDGEIHTEARHAYNMGYDKGITDHFAEELDTWDEA